MARLVWVPPSELKVGDVVPWLMMPCIAGEEEDDIIVPINVSVILSIFESRSWTTTGVQILALRVDIIPSQGNRNSQDTLYSDLLYRRLETL